MPAASTQQEYLAQNFSTMKVVDKMNSSIQQHRPFFSFEFFPPRTDEVCRT